MVGSFKNVFVGKGDFLDSSQKRKNSLLSSLAFPQVSTINAKPKRSAF
jgi:hypothetical protein